MEVAAFLELKPAPSVVFDGLADRADDVRFMVEQASGGWAPVTWAEFAAEIAGCALGLTAKDIGRGDFVAIFADNSVQWLSAALGIQASGAAMVPIYGNSTAEQVAYVVQHSEAKAVFVDSTDKLNTLVAAIDASSALRSNTPTIVCLQDAPGDAPPLTLGWGPFVVAGATQFAAEPSVVQPLLDSIDLDDRALMLYTSGTSGRPKGVPLTHRNVGVNGRDWLQCNGPLVEQSDIDLLWLPFSHIFGFGEACLGNTLGFVSYLCSPLTVLKHMPDVRPHIFMSVPAYVEKLAVLAQQAADPAVELARLTGGRLRFCLSGGAGLKRGVKEFLFAHDILVIEGYGLTEAAPTLTLNRPDAFDFDSVGRPLPSVEIKLASDGEILARGGNVFAGYHKDNDATAAAFTADGWLKTGDLGAFNDAGFLRIIGRKKEILVTAGGKNIPPANIETRFADDPLIDHLVVFGDGEKFLVACVWLNPLQARKIGLSVEEPDCLQARTLVQASVSAVNASLPRYQNVRAFTVMPGALSIENGLLTPTLKVRRNEVYRRFADAFEAMYAETRK